MSVPSVINDGNWNTLIPMESSYEFPFSDKGDHASFRARLKYRQDKDAYRPRSPMTRILTDQGAAYLTKLGDPQDIGSGLFEFEDTFCSVPVKRTEYGVYPFSAQWFAITPDVQIEEHQFILPCEIEYDYAPNTPPSPKLKPRVFTVFGLLRSIGGQPIVGDRTVAEDSEISIYEGRIFQRRTIYVKVKDLASLT